MKDCSSSCPLYDAANETCIALEMLEYDPDGFEDLCPYLNGDPKYKDGG